MSTHTPETVLATVRRIVAVAAQRSPTDGSIDDADLMNGDFELDSVAILDVISTLETEIGFQFKESDLRPRTFKSVRVLAQTIAATLQADA